MKTKLTEAEVQEWRKIATQAAKIESLLEELATVAIGANIDNAHKVKVLNWIDRASPFRGMAYFCTPQSEWLGGDSQDSKNFCFRLPHIAKD